MSEKWGLTAIGEVVHFCAHVGITTVDVDVTPDGNITVGGQLQSPVNIESVATSVGLDIYSTMVLGRMQEAFKSLITDAIMVCRTAAASTAVLLSCSPGLFGHPAVRLRGSEVVGLCDDGTEEEDSDSLAFSTSCPYLNLEHELSSLKEGYLHIKILTGHSKRRLFDFSDPTDITYEPRPVGGALSKDKRGKDGKDEGAEEKGEVSQWGSSLPDGLGVSLRKYLSIHRLRDLFEINLRGAKVPYIDPIKTLTKHQSRRYEYNPKGDDFRGRVFICFGFAHPTPQKEAVPFGLHFYHSNRLVDAFVKCHYLADEVPPFTDMCGVVIDEGWAAMDTAGPSFSQSEGGRYAKLLEKLLEKMIEFRLAARHRIRGGKDDSENAGAKEEEV